MLLTPTAAGLAADFLSAVLVLTFFRVLYGFGLNFVRPSLRKAGQWALFTLVFGGLFALRTGQAIGAKAGPEEVSIYFPYPRPPLVIPRAKFIPPVLRETGAVTILEFPDDNLRFVPAFHFDATAKNRLLALARSLGAGG